MNLRLLLLCFRSPWECPRPIATYPLTRLTLTSPEKCDTEHTLREGGGTRWLTGSEFIYTSPSMRDMDYQDSDGDGGTWTADFHFVMYTLGGWEMRWIAASNIIDISPFPSLNYWKGLCFLCRWDAKMQMHHNNDHFDFGFQTLMLWILSFQIDLFKNHPDNILRLHIWANLHLGAVSFLFTNAFKKVRHPLVNRSSKF